MAGHSSTILPKPAPPTPNCRASEPSEFGESAPAGPAVGPSSLLGKQLATDVYFQGTFGGGANGVCRARANPQTPNDGTVM